MIKTELSLFLFFISVLIYQSKKTLELLDDWNNVESNSLFWKQKNIMGYDIDIKMIIDKDIKISFNHILNQKKFQLIKRLTNFWWIFIW